MICRVLSGTVAGIDGVGVSVEVDVRRGLPSLQIVGLPAASLRESRERVLSAVRNSDLAWPSGRVTVNLRPADVRKDGAAAELAIAVGICVAAAGTAPRGEHGGAVLLGELSLDGTVRPVRGLLAVVLAAAAAGRRDFLVPRAQAALAAWVPGTRVRGVEKLADAVAWYLGSVDLPVVAPAPDRNPPPATDRPAGRRWLTLLSPRSRRVAVVAAAGRHHTLLVGPPGCGKTTLAQLLGELQGDLTREESLVVARIHGAAGTRTDGDLPRRRPFRAPHHTVTRAGLLGGGPSLRPGEVTLAHAGILFLDELAEFPPRVLEALREPLQEGTIAISRGAGTRRWPARFQLVAAANPCRCGYAGSRRRACTCDESARRRYSQRFSGPLLDRIDLFVELEEPREWSLREVDLRAERAAGAWREARTLVAEAARLLRERGGRDGTTDGPGHWRRDLSPAAVELLEEARRRLALSWRGVARCVAVARTIAALAGRGHVEAEDLVEALGYRRETIPLWGTVPGNAPSGI